MSFRSNRSIKTLLAILAAGMLYAGAANSAIVKDEKNLGWYSFRDLTSQQFSARFQSYRSKYMLIDVDAYQVGSQTRYAMVWRRNTDSRGWAVRRDMSSDVYSQRWKEYQKKGWRPIDVETYISGGKRKWAGIWVQNKEKVGWSSHRGQTSEEYSKLFKNKSSSGFRVIDIEVYKTGSTMRYSSIWVRNNPKKGWAQMRGMTRSKYQQEVDKRSKNGYVVVDFEAYDTGNGTRYAAIWEKKPGFSTRARTATSLQQFRNYFRTYSDMGMRLHDFERYQTSNGTRYAGLWVENNDRYDYSRKGRLDKAVKDYSALNNLPGISVVIIQKGKTIYRRGFGFADVAAKKVAHSGTIYDAASVSKVIGGTLAAKLEDEGRLKDGTTFNLDLTQATSTFLSNVPSSGRGGVVSLPGQHTHTLEQLLTHLGCVVHYNTQPTIGDQTVHYNTAVAAVQSIWNVGLVTQRSNGNSGCTIGTTRSYSTHALTFVGAALERRTGRNLARLVNEEIADQYGLGTMRASYTNASLPSRYERAVPYVPRDPLHSPTPQTTPPTPTITDWIDPPHSQNNPNVTTTYQDSSWKILGGGIESSVNDLARFGWKVLNAEITSADVRDNRLLSAPDSSSTNGLGWDLTTVGGRNVAHHDGSWAGTRTYLRIYTDDGLSIAVGSNRRNHRSDQNQDIDDLVTRLGSIVLAPKRAGK